MKITYPCHYAASHVRQTFDKVINDQENLRPNYDTALRSHQIANKYSIGTHERQENYHKEISIIHVLKPETIGVFVIEKREIIHTHLKTREALHIKDWEGPVS